MHFDGRYFHQTKNIILPDSYCHIENAFSWTKLHFVGLNYILSDKVKIQPFSAEK
jgi:hypothetical protein